jgi:hypothetical protein
MDAGAHCGRRYCLRVSVGFVGLGLTSVKARLARHNPRTGQDAGKGRSLIERRKHPRTRAASKPFKK